MGGTLSYAIFLRVHCVMLKRCVRPKFLFSPCAGLSAGRHTGPGGAPLDSGHRGPTPVATPTEYRPGRPSRAHRPWRHGT